MSTKTKQSKVQSKGKPILAASKKPATSEQKVIFKSDVAEDTQIAMDKLIASTNSNLDKSLDSLNQNSKTTQRLLNKLGNNLSNSMNQQVKFCLDSLSCKNASDYLELFHHAFKNNYENSMDFMNDTVSLANHYKNRLLKHAYNANLDK